MLRERKPDFAEKQDANFSKIRKVSFLKMADTKEKIAFYPSCFWFLERWNEGKSTGDPTLKKTFCGRQGNV